jgi:hypothetical protein
MIEREKKARLVEHLKKIANEGDFVECPHKFVAEYLDSLFILLQPSSHRKCNIL